MADYKCIKASATSDDRVIWTAEIKLGESNTYHTLYVLTASTFCFAKYEDPTHHAEALEQVQEAEDPSEVLGKGLVLRLGSILRVEKIPNETNLTIQVRRKEKTPWELVQCPD